MCRAKSRVSVQEWWRLFGAVGWGEELVGVNIIILGELGVERLMGV